MLILHTLLIGAECARLLREYGAGETPQARSAEEAPRNAKRMERKSTDKFNTAFIKEKSVIACIEQACQIIVISIGLITKEMI
jgi:hypothetical protein